MTLESRIKSAVENLGNSELALRAVGTVTHDNVKPLLEALAEHGKHVERVVIEVDRVEDGVLSELLAHLKDNGKVEYVRFETFPPGPKDAAALAEFVGSNIPLRTLEIPNIGLRDDTLVPIMQALANQPGLHNLDISQNPHGTEAINAILPVIPAMSDLASFHFNAPDMLMSKWDEIDEALNITPHPCMVFCSAELKSDLANRQSTELYNFLREMPRNVAGYADFPLTSMQRLERCLPGLQTTAQGDMDLLDILRDYKALLRFAPQLPTNRPVSIEDLITTNEDGVTPLHNPRLFKEQPSLLDDLLTRGELTAETLKRETPQGFSVLDHLAAFAPPHDTLATLAQHDITVSTPGIWFDDAGKPTEAFRLLSKQDDGMAALFDYDHWHDQPTHEIKTLFNGFDEATRDAIPNRHALLATRTQPTHRGVGA